ncbi:MAG TPA: type II secretion system protein [Vicinamibacterales bacterium]|nr:type II secretion system protein [Vicinamibacterales bacterium]
MRRTSSQAGFSLPELMIAMAIMLAISGAAVSALLKMTSTQATVWNRTQMHSGIRGATEVLQQEVGQAGRITLPTRVTLTAPSTSGTAPTLTVSSTSGMFVGEKLVIDTGDALESVVVATIPSSTTITVNSTTSGRTVAAHNATVPVQVFGGFSSGIVPTTTTNGSTGSILKLFGDINADGNMVYIEYTCDTTNHNLYRNVMAWNAAGPSAAPAASQILLSNIIANPNGTDCFTYQTATVSGTTFVTDVAITLTVQTQLIDPITKQYQTETKALLNVSPRNVFNAWLLASLGINDRIQPMPPSITALLP